MSASSVYLLLRQVLYMFTQLARNDGAKDVDLLPAPPGRGAAPTGTPPQLGIEQNTLIVWTTDNGVWQDVYPDCGYTPFRGAKGTDYEGGSRVPAIAWWPGTIEAGRRSADPWRRPTRQMAGAADGSEGRQLTAAG